MGIVEVIQARFEGASDSPAIIAAGGGCSFGELGAAVLRWTGKLEAEGIGPGSVVGLEGDFSPTSIALFLALAGGGAIVVPHERGRTDLDERENVAQVEVRCRVDVEDGVGFEPTGRSASHALYEQLRRRRHPGLVQFTSGTSGEPKAALHDSSALLEKFRRRRPALRTLAFLLFDHLGGINTMLHTLSNGAALVTVGRDRSPEGVCRAIEDQRVELLPTTPTFLNLLLLSGAHRRHDLGSLRRISYGAEPMPEATLARLHAAFPGVRLQQTYGMVELGAMRTKSRGDGSLWVKVGGEGFETRVVDGRLEVRARSLLLGYLNAPTPVDAEGWFATGDMVERDGEYLRFLGRDTDLINVGGEKVHPTEVECVIESMDGVAEAIVHGEPNALVGEVVCARVWSSDHDEDGDDLARRVKRHCGERLPRFKVPVKVDVRKDRPTERGVKKSRRRVWHQT